MAMRILIRFLFHFFLVPMFSIIFLFFNFAEAQKVVGDKDLPKYVAAPKDVSDGQLQHRLSQIFKTSGWFPDLKVEVKEGLVFLSGKVPSGGGKKDWLFKIIDKTEGVVGIIDNLEDGNRKAVLSPVQEEVSSMLDKAERITPYILSALVLFIIFCLLAYGLSRMIYRMIRNQDNTNSLLASAVSNMVALIVTVLGLYFALRTSGLSALAMTVLGGTGFIGIGIGLALKSTFENYSASLMISLREIFRKSEWVRIGEVEGIVHSVTTRGTTLIDFEGTTITIPNASVFNSVIRNFTRNPHMRADCIIGIGINESINKTSQIILKVLSSIEDLLKEPEPIVLVHELAPTTIRLRLYFWFDALKISRAKIRSMVFHKCILALRKENISLESDSREIRFMEPLMIQQVQDKDLEKRQEENLKEEVDSDVNKLNQQKKEVRKKKSDIEVMTDLMDLSVPAEKGANLLKN